MFWSVFRSAGAGWKSSRWGRRPAWWSRDLLELRQQRKVGGQQQQGRVMQEDYRDTFATVGEHLCSQSLIPVEAGQCCNRLPKEVRILVTAAAFQYPCLQVMTDLNLL